MAMASLTADLLARKGNATPTSVQPLYREAPARETQKSPDVFEIAWKKLLESRPEKTANAPKTRIHKSFYLADKQHHQLRMLAARTGKSQQAVMEEALCLFLEQMQEKGACICGKSRP